MFLMSGSLALARPAVANESFGTTVRGHWASHANPER